MESMESWGVDQQQDLMITTDIASNMIKAVKMLGEVSEKDDETDEDGDIEDPGGEFVPITKLKRTTRLAHS